MMKERGEELSEEEKRALRGSKFAPLQSLPPPRAQPQQPRLAHPGGPLTTNKAAALAKFLERKLQDPNGLNSINPHLVERAVQNAKRTVFTSGASSSSGITVRHVDSFDDSESEPQQEVANSEPKKLKKKNKKQKNKKSDKKKRQQKIMEDSGCAVVKRPKKKKLKC